MKLGTSKLPANMGVGVMKMDRLGRSAFAIVFLGFLSIGNVSAREAVSPNPHHVLQDYERTRGQDVQKVSGGFVSALRIAFAATSSRQCLKDHAPMQMPVQVYSSGDISVESHVCELPSTATGNLTDEITLPAARILALVLVADTFQTDPHLSKYDTDLSGYDVEIYGKAYKNVDAFRVTLMPVSVSTSWLGCTPSGPIAVTYSVDVATFAVKLLPLVC